MIREILAPNAGPMTLDGTRTFVVGRRRPAVVDPGPDDPAHLEAVVAALEGRRPTILLTHAHPDHAAGAPALAARTGAAVRMARGAGGPSSLADVVTGWLVDDEEIGTDAGVLRTVATPGHAPEHACFLLVGQSAKDRALFAGDMFMGGSDTTLVAPPEGNLTDYLASLERIASLGAANIYPAHGPPLHDPAAAVERYRAHRLERIAQVVHALRNVGRAPAEALVDAVYGPTLDPRLRPAAAGSIAAILAHLRATGRVAAHADNTYTLEN